jgi:hypothetical protein
MSDYCFACKESLELTVEHIIPQALGGRLKAKLYCKTCNETFGREIDNEISKQFGWVGTMLNIKRERGRPQPYEITDLSSGSTLIFDGEDVKRKKPIVVITSKDGKKLDSADITARSEKELTKICASIQKQYEMSGEMKTFLERKPGPLDAELEVTIDNDLLRRAISKVAYGFLCIKVHPNLALSSAFDEIRDFIMNGRGPNLASANFIDTVFMTDNVRPLHKIHIVLNRTDKLVVGFVSIFGVYRFTVLLAENFESQFEWPGLDYTYDPVRRKEVIANHNFRAPRLSKTQIIKPRQTKTFVHNELHKGHKLLDSYVDITRFLGGNLN